MKKYIIIAVMAIAGTCTPLCAQQPQNGKDAQQQKTADKQQHKLDDTQQKLDKKQDKADKKTRKLHKKIRKENSAQRSLDKQQNNQ